MKSLTDEKEETLDDLMCGFSVIQPKEGFRFSLDSVLLAHFAGVKENDMTADICSGSGVVAFLLLAHKRPKKVFCVEIQPSFCSLIKRSAEYNRAEDKIEVVCGDVSNTHELLGCASMDSVTCNPPYLKNGTGKGSENESLNISKREVMMTLETAVEAAGKILKSKGRFSVVHIAKRADELFYLMNKHGMPVKRARLVQPETGSVPSLILAEGVKNAAPGVKWLPVLNIYEDGQYSKELKEIYGIE